MIIVKTSNGDVFVNEKEMRNLFYDHNEKCVTIREDQHDKTTILKVEAVTYHSDSQTVSYTDEGSLVQQLRDDLEKANKEIKRLGIELLYSSWKQLAMENVYNDILALVENGENTIDESIISLVKKTKSYLHEYNKDYEKRIKDYE